MAEEDSPQALSATSYPFNPFQWRLYREVRPADNTILGKPFEDVRVHYTIGKELGRGQFGVTYLCTEISTGKKYACKSMNYKEDIKREIQIMQDLSGQPNIVEFKGCYEDKQSVHVCMELNSCQARRTATP
ncbi:hypothetical protein ACFX15_045554 [Malus domestica]